MTETPRSQPPISGIADYRVVRELAPGVGGMSAVYQAIAPDGRTQVAIKVAHERYYHQLLEEANTLLKVQNPNIVRILPIESTSAHRAGQIYVSLALVGGESRAIIVLEYLGGGSLQDLLVRQGRLDPRMACWIARDVALGLARAHEQGVVHFDIKPSNILFDIDRRRAVVLDFGIARRTDGDELPSGRVLGTLVYTAPERLRFEQGDQRADVYALGVCLFEMLTGRRPYVATDATEIRRLMLSTDPPPPSSVDPKLAPFDALVLGCLARDPARRLASCRLIAEAVEPYVNGRDVPRLALATAAGIGLLVVVGFAGLTMAAGGSPTVPTVGPFVVAFDDTPGPPMTPTVARTGRATATPLPEATDTPLPTATRAAASTAASPTPTAVATATSGPPQSTPTSVSGGPFGSLFRPTNTPETRR